MTDAEPQDSVNIRASGYWARWVVGAFVAILVAGVTHFVAFRDVQRDVVTLSSNTTMLTSQHETILKRVAALEARIEAAVKDNATTSGQVSELRKDVRELMDTLHRLDKSIISINGRLDTILEKLGSDKRN